MPSERTQRRIDAFLDEAEAAATRREWDEVAEKARAVLAMDPENEDAPPLLRAAEANGASAALPASSFPSGGSTLAPSTGAGGGGGASPAPQPESFAAGRYHVRKFLGEGTARVASPPGPLSICVARGRSESG